MAQNRLISQIFMPVAWTHPGIAKWFKGIPVRLSCLCSTSCLIVWFLAYLRYYSTVDVAFSVPVWVMYEPQQQNCRKKTKFCVATFDWTLLTANRWLANCECHSWVIASRLKVKRWWKPELFMQFISRFSFERYFQTLEQLLLPWSLV